MDYLLDSNTVSEIYDKYSSNHHQIIEQLSSLSDEDQVFISVITLYELEYGYSNAPKNIKSILRKKINEAKDDFYILPLTEEGSIYFGKIKKFLVEKRKLKKEGAKKHNIDIILASTAVINSCILISADKIYSELKQQEPKLKIKDWSKVEL